MLIICTAIAAASIGASTASDVQIVKDFCEVILMQSKSDATNCYEKPSAYSKSTGDKAILIYLCCLGFFQDVTHDYLPYLAVDFLDYVAAMDSDKHIMAVAIFVMTCRRDKYQLTYADFANWTQNEENLESCIVK